LTKIGNEKHKKHKKATSRPVLGSPDKTPLLFGPDLLAKREQYPIFTLGFT